ncbi:hypothetical protein I312_103898 [Cryptococcus bacillisporus CA1280]|uniref:uncharacterized protein n=1 Tax=Cryptococcus bacillisporus CA1280 TaxID=1296109 RepID=UPI0033682DB5
MPSIAPKHSNTSHPLPANSAHPSPNPRNQPHTSKSASRPRTKASNQRSIFSDSDSELSPPSSEGDDGEAEADENEQYDEVVTPRKGQHKGRVTQNNATSVEKSGKKKTASQNKKGKKVVGKKKSHPVEVVTKTTTTGPAGREKKRSIKLEDAERRRARDAKFDVDDDFGNTTPTPSLIQGQAVPPDDSTSSYGDDESDKGELTEDDQLIAGIPEAFLGQEVEDLAYGAGDMDTEMMTFWDDETDEDEEEMFINHLSGSEVDRLSQSSVSADSDQSTSESESDAEEVLDEFGFPIPSSAHFPIDDTESGEDPGLILMENWDGQFVLVQPRQERSRSRHRTDRGSRTGGSVNGSTTSGNDQALLIDPDAADHEFSSDDSYWSGMSDEDDDDGDTTDSMAEEDMPVLDSPALNGMMEHQMAEAVLRMVVDGDIPVVLPEAANTGSTAQPSIVVTEVEESTPALSTTSSAPPTNTLPDTPAPLLPTPSSSTDSTTPAAPKGPVMGTFLPVTDDPAQHAVIDGSGNTTKSPFTHRRRSRRNRDAASLASSKDDKERRRRSSASDPFSPAFSPSANALSAKSKRLRYSSIPGHPRYVAARRAAEALAMAEEDRATTTSEDEAADGAVGGFELEDMLEEAVLLDPSAEGQEEMDGEGLRHMLRFDRVGVSTYLRRNFGTPNPVATLAPPDRGKQPPYNYNYAVGGYLSPGNTRLDDTLAGPIGGRMLVSPVLTAVEEVEGEVKARREKKKRRKAQYAAKAVPELMI